MSMTDW